ncbi:Geranylgeranyl diphosphate synthase sdnC [Naviculisporaceae sp. PSN 640]
MISLLSILYRTMSVDQFSPFMTLGKLDAVYDDYTHTAVSDTIPSKHATVSTDPVLESADGEMVPQTTSTEVFNGVSNVGLDSTSTCDATPSFNSNNLPELDKVSDESIHEASAVETKDINSTSDESISDSATTVTNSTSPGPSPSQSSATSVVADECPSDDHPNEDVANLSDIALQPEVAEVQVPPTPPVGEQETPTITPDASDSDQTFSIFTQDHNPILSGTIVSAPAQYVASTPGKKIRDKAASALNIWLQVPLDDLNQIRSVIDMLHNASLILDDVEDGSVSRRGRPATHMIFGMPQAINSAGYQINRAMMEVLKLGSRECLEIFIEELDRLYIGQGYDLFWTFNIKRPSVEKYISMVDYKTGSLFNMLVRFMAAKTGAGVNNEGDGQKPPIPPPDLTRLVVLLGRYFQIRDDYMNLTSDEYTLQKGFCDDLDEGKFSLTLVHALENSTEAEKSILRHLLTQRLSSNGQGMSLAQKHLVIDIVKSAGSLEYTVTALRKIGVEIVNELDRIEGITGIENKELRGLMKVLLV